MREIYHDFATVRSPKRFFPQAGRAIEAGRAIGGAIWPTGKNNWLPWCRWKAAMVATDSRKAETSQSRKATASSCLIIGQRVGDTGITPYWLNRAGSPSNRMAWLALLPKDCDRHGPVADGVGFGLDREIQRSARPCPCLFPDTSCLSGCPERCRWSAKGAVRHGWCRCCPQREATQTPPAPAITSSSRWRTSATARSMRRKSRW